MIGARAERWPRSSLTRANVDSQLIPFFGQAVQYFLRVIIIVSVLQFLGVETTSLVAVIGAAGLALHGTLTSFAAGVKLLIMRPFKIGDAIAVSGSTGVVVEVTLFVATLNTFDNVRIIIPNSAVYGAIIKNFSARHGAPLG